MSLFKNPERAKQLVDFSGLNVEGTNIYPSDLDFILELWDVGYMFGEFKYKGKEVERGQDLYLTRIVRATEKADKFTISFVADHYISDTHEMIPADKCIVRKYMFTGIYTWIYPKKETTVKELQDWFVQKCRFKKQYKNKH